MLFALPGALVGKAPAGKARIVVFPGARGFSTMPMVRVEADALDVPAPNNVSFTIASVRMKGRDLMSPQNGYSGSEKASSRRSIVRFSVPVQIRKPIPSLFFSFRLFRFCG